MKYAIFLRIALVALAVSVAAQTGCLSSKASRFYVLDSLPQPESGPEGTARPGRLIGIGPVTLPEYLDRPQIVTKAGENRIAIAEFERWAEPLQEGFSRALAEDLSALLPADRTALFPWNQSAGVGLQVVVEVVRFDGVAGGTATLICRWRVAGGGGADSGVRQSSFDAPVEGKQYEHLVAAMSRTLEAFSRAVAEDIRSRSGIGARPQLNETNH